MRQSLLGPQKRTHRPHTSFVVVAAGPQPPAAAGPRLLLLPAVELLRPLQPARREGKVKQSPTHSSITHHRPSRFVAILVVLNQSIHLRCILLWLSY